MNMPLKKQCMKYMQLDFPMSLLIVCLPVDMNTFRFFTHTSPLRVLMRMQSSVIVLGVCVCVCEREREWVPVPGFSPANQINLA